MNAKVCAIAKQGHPFAVGNKTTSINKIKQTFVGKTCSEASKGVKQ